MKVEDEDRWGNQICGEDFMAGSICSRLPGHPGPHEMACLNCGGDNLAGTCSCDSMICEECGNDLVAEGESYCTECLESFDPPPATTPPAKRLIISTLFTPDDLEMVRVALLEGQRAIHRTARGRELAKGAIHQRVLGRLLDDIERQRPLGPDGKHGNRHTPHCQCPPEQRSAS